MTEEIFKKLWFQEDERVKKYLNGIVEYALGEPLGDYEVKEFENEILLITDDTVYLVKLNKKPHTNEEDAKFLQNFITKLYNQFEELADSTFKYLALNAFYNPDDEKIVKIERTYAIN